MKTFNLWNLTSQRVIFYNFSEYVKNLERNQGIREIPRNFKVYRYSLTQFYIAGDYMKSLNFMDYMKSLVTHIPCNIYMNIIYRHNICQDCNRYVDGLLRELYRLYRGRVTKDDRQTARWEIVINYYQQTMPFVTKNRTVFSQAVMRLPKLNVSAIQKQKCFTVVTVFVCSILTIIKTLLFK